MKASAFFTIAPSANRLLFVTTTVIVLFILLTTPLARAGKPPAWGETVRKAAGAPPVFWLDGAASPNEGTVNSGPTDYAEGKWERTEEGFWGEQDGSFGLSAEALSGVRARATKLTDIAASPDGALAVLFRAPSSFGAGEPHSIVNRGDYSAAVPFELSIHNGQLRLAARVNDKQKALDLQPIEPGEWYWVALDWKQADGGGTDLEWRAWSRSQGSRNGTLETEGLGNPESLLQLGGRTVGCTLLDGVLSQVIVWDRPVGESGWTKLEALLSPP
jgi:hypothetical protein